MGPMAHYLLDKIINFKLLFCPNTTGRIKDHGWKKVIKSPTRSVGFLVLYFTFICILYRLK